MFLAKNIKCAVFAAFASVLAFGQTSLGRCIEMAYSNYPQIKEYDLIEASRQYDLKNASLAWAPQLNISGKASWQSSVVEMPFEIPGMQFNIPHDQYGITADLTQQIWDGGATAAKKRLAEVGADVKGRQLDVNLYNIRSRVQNIYLGIVLIDRQLNLNEVLRAKLERNLGEVASMLEAGVASETDRDQIRVSILSCEQQKSALLADRKAYVRMLGMMTGQDMDGVEFSDPSTEVKVPVSEEVLRPEIALYEAQARQIEAQRQQLNANISPKLNLNLQGGYGRPGLNMLSGKFDPYFVAGLKLQWNIGSLYTLRNDRRKLEAESSKLDITRRSFLLNTSIEAVQKRSEMEKAADVLERDGQIISLRENISRTAERQYKEGVIKMNDYLGHLDEEFNARLDKDIHELQYVMAVCDYRNTIGSENK